MDLPRDPLQCSVLFAFRVFCVLSAVASVALAARLRGGVFARFVGVLLGVHTLSVLALSSAFGPLLPVAFWTQVAACAHVVSLLRPRMRPVLWRALVSWPGQWFVAGTFLAVPWAVVAATPWVPHGWWIPFVVALFGLVQSTMTHRETLRMDLGAPSVGPLRRAPEIVVARRRGLHGDFGGLRVVQITDPHLGPFMSVDRLRAICERAVLAKPDLILLTGDMFTMDGQHTPGILSLALAPLRAHPAVYAVRGNHDLECPDIVADQLTRIGARLLIDEVVVAQTRLGPVELVGMDFHWRDREAKIERVFAGLSRPPLRLVLQHDPGAFRLLREGSADLVLSGHTHGGQVGLLSLGFSHTAVSALSSVPDHGPWVHQGNRLYVHRATGHYGFPLRVGVPAEESVLELMVPAPR